MSKSKTPQSDPQQEIEAEFEICRRPLRDFSNNRDDLQGFARSGKPCIRIPVDRAKIPVALSISLSLRLLLNCHDLGRTEKLTWEYPFTYQEVECSISHEKFGIRLYVERTEAGKRVEPDKIVSKISAATRMMEKKLLSMMGKQALLKGDVTIPNLYYKLRGMYEYFRTVAQGAYAGNGELARQAEGNDVGTWIVGPLNRNLASRQEGLYATVAMVTSYFSLLEHTLVLSIPSTDFDPSAEEISSFIGLPLFDKYDRTFRKGQNKDAQRIREKLKIVAETWRNPYSHGGFDKLRKAIGFHVEGVGVLPMGLSSIASTQDFHLFPEKDQGFDELCRTFDEIDDFLTNGPLWASMQWVTAGLDVPLDKESLVEFRRAAEKGATEMSSNIDHTSHLVDQAMNMDW
ncbi:hypothetical protein AB0H48_06305 [Streptomyces globisporus]|uniref:hypothetical protein n=1 Tax=Streptomyces globisporus TaxID=1908 RepID=UPI0034617143